MEFYCSNCDEFLTYQSCPYCGKPCADTNGLSEARGGLYDDPSELDFGDELDVSDLEDDDEDGDEGDVGGLDFGD